MPNYKFRVRFRLPHSSGLNHDKPVLDLRPSGQGDYTLRAPGKQPIKDSQWLVLEDSGDGFSTEEEAADAGDLVRSAILWCGIQMRLGMDIGDDKAHGGATQYLKRRVRREQGIRLLNDVHGLNVYEKDPKLPTRFISGSASGQGLKGISQFEQHFNEAMDMNLHLTDKENLACELYGLSHFESSVRARFLTLVIAIESITKAQRRSDSAVDHVEQLIEATRNSSLPSPEVDSLCKILGNLKNESISKSGRDLVDRCLGQSQYGNKTAKSFFQDCYNIRSELVHSGKPTDEATNLGQLVNVLDQLVADLLTSYFRMMR